MISFQAYLCLLAYELKISSVYIMSQCVWKIPKAYNKNECICHQGTEYKKQREQYFFFWCFMKMCLIFMSIKLLETGMPLAVRFSHTQSWPSYHPKFIHSYSYILTFSFPSPSPLLTFTTNRTLFPWHPNMFQILGISSVAFSKHRISRSWDLEICF